MHEGPKVLSTTSEIVDSNSPFMKKMVFTYVEFTTSENGSNSLKEKTVELWVCSDILNNKYINTYCAFKKLFESLSGHFLVWYLYICIYYYYCWKKNNY